MKNSRKNPLFRQILAATLLVSGASQLAAPVLAIGTFAGTPISNTGTATYEDPNAPGVRIDSTSNTVTITVAEVAGIAVTSQAVTDTTPATPVVTNDTVNYDFQVTNVGNDSTRFFIPGTATINGGTQGTIQIIAVNGVALGTAINVPAGGSLTSALAGFPNGGVIAANSTVTVRVPVTVTANASNANISVVLGNTGANDNSAGTQNQLFPTAPAGNDLYTSDNPTASAGLEAGGTPVNGEREASALGSVQLGAQPQAFAAVLKTRTAYSNNSTPTPLSDDVLTYGLSLRVDAAGPAGSTGLVAANLVGTTINVTGPGAPAGPVVLISDAIPTGTDLSSVAAPPSGWITVYSTDDPALTGRAANDPLVPWTTTAPALNTVKRIGFINPGPIAAGTTVTGFSFSVVTTRVTVTTTVANIAQLFGQTQNVAGTILVYDESGDQAPSNSNDNGTSGSNVPTSGTANPAVDGEDVNNNNTGTGAGGEDNVFTISAPGSVLNGPNGFPAAVHTTNNDDFTNKSAVVPPNTPAGTNFTYDPGVVTFTNTISNPSSTAINGLLLSPTPPAPGELPNGTTVRLTVGTQSATYTYNGTVFNYTPVAGDTAIIIGSLLPGASFNYTVAVDLPGTPSTTPPNTPLSTDTGNGFPVPIVAFVDQNANGSFESTVDTTTNNITIDRVYTGFLRLAKQARILNGDGTVITGYNSPFFITPTTADSNQFLPGRIIEYQITYTNISTNTTGTNNAVANASRVFITEDGALSPNNWALDNDGIGGIDTSHVGGPPPRAVTVGGGVIEYFNGATSLGTTDPGTSATVTRYTVTVPGAVAPAGAGTFTFQRRLN